MGKVVVTKKFREDLANELNKTVMTRQEVAESLKLNSRVIRDCLNSEVSEIDAGAYIKLENWIASDKCVKKSEGEKLIPFVEWQALKTEGHSSQEIQDKLGIAQREIKTKSSTKYQFIGVKTDLARAVFEAKGQEKFLLISKFRDALIADYGKTLMDVPDDEPRLKRVAIC
ncbi:hypothetical protein [uncultured Weissella sp.]|uniref:hypothetical protein n=1 Tax=uncultured Weissella sp. TaxID=253243 RepID=UPI0027DC0C32|nr:hypothetical protein [uncultured Weissella sp.]